MIYAQMYLVCGFLFYVIITTYYCLKYGSIGNFWVPNKPFLYSLSAATLSLFVSLIGWPFLIMAEYIDREHNSEQEKINMVRMDRATRRRMRR